MKVKMTKNRIKILEKLNSSSLAWGYGDQGGKEYFFTDGTSVQAGIVERMIDCGLLAYKADVLGVGQEIIRA